MHTHHQLFHLPHHRVNKLTVLYVVSTIRTFVASFINVFIPVILYKQFILMGYNQKISIFLAIGFLFLFTFVMALITTSVSKVISKYGFKTGFITAFFFLVLFFIFSTYTNSLLLTSITYIILGISQAFWWTTYHIYFIEIVHSHFIGRKISIMEMCSIAAGLVGPIIGGLILTLFGNSALFIFAILLIFIASSILLSSKENVQVKPVTLFEVMTVWQKHKRDFVSFLGASGVDTIYCCAWSLFLYLIINNYLKMGAIYTGIAVITFFILYFIGKIIDSSSKVKMEKFGSGIISISWIGKAIFQNAPLILIFDAIYKMFFNAFIAVPLVAIAYSNAAREEKVRYILFRELSCRVGDLTVLAIFLIFIWFEIPIWMMFVVAALFSLLPFAENE
jgi:MFS family permease